jgi:hypothetical protein
LITGQDPTKRFSGAATVDLDAGELEKRRTVSTALVVRHNTEVMHRFVVKGDVAHGAVSYLEKVGMHEPITEHVPPAPSDPAGGIGMLVRRKDMGQCLLARGTF